MTTFPRPVLRTAATAAALATALLLSSCGAEDTARSSAPSSSPSQAGSSAVVTPSDQGAPGDPAAAAAWEALMSPEGEYAAFASYQAVIEKFGEVEPYVSIAQMETRHAAALTRQLERMGVEVPENPYLGEIAAPEDLQAAAQAWAEGEVRNVAMYDDLMDQASSDPMLTRVLMNLRASSQDEHLPMFRLAAEGDGTLTEAQMAEVMPDHGGMGGGMGHGGQLGAGKGQGGNA